MKKGYSIEGEVIVINRELTDLDLFLKGFLEVLTQHSDYLVVSGYISISSGRTRATEDIDILVPIMSKEKLSAFFKDLENNNFWCYQGNDIEEIHEYLTDYVSIRFARKDETFPNMEFVPIDETKKAKWFEFSHPQKIRIKDLEFSASPIEFEILYKEIVLAGKKNIEDAAHLRTFFEEMLDNKKFKEYEIIVREVMK